MSVVCYICGNRYLANKNLNYHLRIKHYGKHQCFTCEICSKTFTSPYGLVTHAREQHSKELTKEAAKLCNIPIEKIVKSPKRKLNRTRAACRICAKDFFCAANRDRHEKKCPKANSKPCKSTSACSTGRKQPHHETETAPAQRKKRVTGETKRESEMRLSIATEANNQSAIAGGDKVVCTTYAIVGSSVATIGSDENSLPKSEAVPLENVTTTLTTALCTGSSQSVITINTEAQQQHFVLCDGDHDTEVMTGNIIEGKSIVAV